MSDQHKAIRVKEEQYGLFPKLSVLIIVTDNLTVEKQIVLDPFMGAKTFSKAGLRLKRQFIRMEIDPQKFEFAKTNPKMRRLNINGIELSLN